MVHSGLRVQRDRIRRSPTRVDPEKVVSKSSLNFAQLNKWIVRDKCFKISHFPRMHHRGQWFPISWLKYALHQKDVHNFLRSIIGARVLRRCSTARTSTKERGGNLVSILRWKGSSSFVHSALFVAFPCHRCHKRMVLARLRPKMLRETKIWMSWGHFLMNYYYYYYSRGC